MARPTLGQHANNAVRKAVRRSVRRAAFEDGADVLVRAPATRPLEDPAD